MRRFQTILKVSCLRILNLYLFSNITFKMLQGFSLDMLNKMKNLKKTKKKKI